MNDNKGLVSIVVPVYNVEPYIRKCLESILNQNYKNLEILIVNDGSPDNSEEIILEYTQIDDRIKYIKQSNGGLGAARNTGIRNAKGEFICFVDSDDWISCNYVERLIDTINKENSDVVICNMIYQYSDGTIKKRTPHIDKNECIDNVEAVKREFIGEQYKFHAPNKFCRLSVLKSNGIYFPEGKLYEDVFTTYKILINCNKVSLICDNLYFYLQNRSGSIMNTSINERRFIDMYEALDEIIRNKQVRELGLNDELLYLYSTNVISLVNYIYPLIGKTSYKKIKKYFSYIKDDANYNYLKKAIYSPKLKFIVKIRVFMILHCLYLYCCFMKVAKMIMGG